MSSRLTSALFFAILLALPLAANDTNKRPVAPTGDGSALAGRSAIATTELDAIRFERAFEKAVQGAEDQPREGELDGLALGVWVSRRTYREGEPIPTLFAVRNQGVRRGLDLRIDLSTSLASQYNSARIDLDRTDPGNFWGQSRVVIQVCGSEPLTTIERNGYYCSGGDLRSLGEGHLPPGTYRLSWAYRGLKSNVVRFAVQAATGPLPPPRTAAHRFAVLEIGGGKLERLASDREHTLRLTGARVGRCWTGLFGERLACGVAGKHYPDLRNLPVVDGSLEASARWTHSGRTGRAAAVEVTLRPTAIAGVLGIERNVRLGLLIDHQPGAVPLKREAPSPGGDSKDTAATPLLVLDRPLTYRIELPEGWMRYLQFSGPARVAVVVTSERIFDRPSRQTLEMGRTSRHPSVVPWKGILRSPWLDLEIPAAPGSSKR